MFSMFVRTLKSSRKLLAPLFPSLGTKQIGRAPFDTGSPLDLRSDDVEAVTDNAARV